MHKGVDLRLAVGDSVRVAWDGRVRIRKNQGRRKGYGLYLVVRHPNGLETVYGHLSKQLVNKNDSVKAGQVIALGGNTGRSTGPHLHLEFRFMGVALDPAELLDFNTFEPKNNLYHFKKKHALLVQEGLAGEGDAAYHRVKKGDTLGGIAWKYHTSVERLCRLNGIRASKTLRIGQRIRYK
jgi:murein DD-endopeptidase MepM/ murein hydrolase activator NlpD